MGWKHEICACLLTVSSFLVAAVAIAGTPSDLSISLNAAEPLSVPDGRYPVILSLWSQPVGGELLWEGNFSGVLIRDGRLRFHVTPFLADSIDIASAWIEVVVNDRVVAERIALTDYTDLYATLGDSGLQFYNPLGVDFPLSYAYVAGNNFNNSLVLSSGTGGIIDFSQQREGGGWSGTVFAIDQNGRAEAMGGWDAGLESGSGFLMLGDSDSSTSVVLDDNEIQARNGSAASTLHLNYHGGDVKVGSTVIGSSDRRQKQSIADLELGLEEVLRLRPVSFEWRNDPGLRRLGLVAQEVRGVVDEVVFEDEEGMLGLSYDSLLPVLIRALQEQQAEIDALRTEVEKLKANTAGQ